MSHWKAPASCLFGAAAFILLQAWLVQPFGLDTRAGGAGAVTLWMALLYVVLRGAGYILATARYLRASLAIVVLQYVWRVYVVPALPRDQVPDILAFLVLLALSALVIAATVAPWVRQMRPARRFGRY
ncbi:MAG: hypothetical protein AB7O67_22720 [Vicinamibacterales bacterium]